MKWAKLLYAVVLLGLCLEVVLVAPKRLGRRQEVLLKKISKLSSQRLAQEADQAFKGMHLIETKAGLRIWELNSEFASEFKGKGELILDKIKTRFFGNSGIQFFVRGEVARVDMDTNDMMISGKVITKTSNNYEMASETISYVASTRQLHSSSPISILGPKDKKGNRLKLHGVGLQAQVESGIVEIMDNVHGEMILESGEELRIKSQSVTFSSLSKVARFSGNVVMDVDSLRVTGPNAEFQYSEDGEELTALYVEGGVKVSDIDKFATAQNVRVDFQEETLVFKGRPRLVRGNDEVYGEEIVFSNGGQRVRVKGARAQIDSNQIGDEK